MPTPNITNLIQHYEIQIHVYSTRRFQLRKKIHLPFVVFDDVVLLLFFPGTLSLSLYSVLSLHNFCNRNLHLITGNGGGCPYESEAFLV